MKKSIFTLSLIGVFAISVFAQTEYDALRQSQTDLNGTARYMSLGGAMGALGADASAIKDNPAGLGVYRSSELTATMNLSMRNVDPIVWSGTNALQNGTTSLKFDNVSYVTSLPVSGSNNLVGSNFSFSYQKLADYNKSFGASGQNQSVSFTDYLANYSNPERPIPGDISYYNSSMPWLTVMGYNGFLLNVDPNDPGYFESVLSKNELVSPAYGYHQSGSMSEFSFGWGGNYNNNLFVGINMNIRNLEYRMYSTLKERFEQGGSFELENDLSQSGIGVNAKLGVIYLPTNNLRLGASLHTPTIMSISEYSGAVLYSTLIPDSLTNPERTPAGGNVQSFNLWSPMQMHLSAAYLFGKRGLITGEYNFVNYQGMKYHGTMDSNQAFGEVNLYMKDVVNNVHMLKVGTEFRATPNFALRAGLAASSPAVNTKYDAGKFLVGNSVNTNTEYFNQIDNTYYSSLGVGYRTTGGFIDVAFVHRSQKEEFFPYQHGALDPITLNHRKYSVVLSAGIRM